MADVEEYFGLTGKAAQEAAMYCDSDGPYYDEDNDPRYDDDENVNYSIKDEDEEQEDWREWNDLYGVSDELAYKLIEEINKIKPNKHEIQNLELVATIVEHNDNFTPGLLAALVECAHACDAEYFISFFKEAIAHWKNMSEDELNVKIQELDKFNIEKSKVEKTPYPFNINEDEIPF